MNLADKESVGSNSSTTLPPSASFTTHPRSIAVAGAMASPRQMNDKCFRCQEIGHWAQNCPNKTPNTRSSPPKSPADHGVPPLHCPCQAGQCVVLVAGPTSQHPGWKYYRCPASGARRCRFFLWCKDVKMEDIIKRPICGCEAGECRIVGKFFVCPIKRGQGACSFRIPLDGPTNQSDNADTSLMSTLTDCHETVENPELAEVQGYPYYLSDEQLEAYDLDVNISSPQSTLTNSGNNSPSNSDVAEDGDIAHLRIEIDPNGPLNVEADEVTLDVPLQRHKRLRHGAPKENGSTLGSATKPPQLSTARVDNLAAEETFNVSQKVSGLASEDSVHLRQMEFSRQIALAEDSPLGDTSIHSSPEATHLPISSGPMSHNYLEATALFEALGFKGWCGRLVYLPSQGLQFAQPKPSSRDAPQLTCDEMKGSAEGPLLKVSPVSKMAEKVSRFQNQMAMQLQNELLSELESTDFHEHEFLADEAAITFDLLEKLSVQYQPFKDMVDEFINKAKSLAEAEESINSDMTSFELFEKQKCKQQRLEEVTRRHSETLVALDASNQHLEELEKEVTRLREMLAHAEEKLDGCKAENDVIRTELDLISKDKSESEVSFEVASIETDEALKIQRQKEDELGAAKAVFDKARSNLRQGCLTYLT